MADITKLESELWEAADALRANSKLSSQEYCMPVLGLIFLRYAWGRFKRVDAQIDKERAQMQGRKPPKTPADYTARGAMYLPEEARYNYLVDLPVEQDIGKAVNDAMAAIAKDNPNLQGVLPDTYTELGNDILREVLRIFNNPALDEDGDDIIGRIYEYFLNKFAPLVANDDGVFFTPKSLVRMVMNVLEPERGTMLDPACGSGGMFVSASDYVRERGGNPSESMMYYGQEKIPYNAKLCLMNMAVHGMQGNIMSGDAANSFYHDAFHLQGKCDYVAANPPFNVDKVKYSRAVDAGRMPLGIPKENKKGEVSTSGANYLWINYFYSYLNDTGRAGFVMASSATDSSGEKQQRRALVESGDLDALLYVGNNFFYTKSLPCTLWFFDKGKPHELRDKVLFIDAQRYHTAVSTTLNEWTPWQLKNLSAIVWLYRGELDKYQSLLEEYYAFVRDSAKLFGDPGSSYQEPGAFFSFMKDISSPGDFEIVCKGMKDIIEVRKSLNKTYIENLSSRQRKQAREELTAEIDELEKTLTVVEEAVWLAEKFGDGEYVDIPGLCKIATSTEIRGDQDADKSSWSLTPGAYVGVPPVEDDGVDFNERMKEIHAELLELQAESNRLMQTISENLEELGL